MKNFVRNTLLLSAVVGASASSVSAADCYYPTQPCCSEWSVGDGKFTIGADYLYWKSEQDNLNIVSTTFSNNTPIATNAVYLNETVNHKPTFDFESGYRAYVGYELPCDQWEIGAVYTYIPGKGSVGNLTGVVDTTNNTVFVVNDGIQDVQTYSSFSGHWDSTFQYADIELARTLKFGESFRLRPHAGFRAAWGDQSVHTHGNLDGILITAQQANYLASHTKQKFNAYGVEAGLWGEWNVFCNFSVIGHFGGSILYNKTTVHQQLDYSFIAANTTLVATDKTSTTIHSALPSVDYFLGARWKDNFCDWDFSIHAGWESHVWFDLGNLYGAGNFSTQGLTAGLDVSF